MPASERVPPLTVVSSSVPRWRTFSGSTISEELALDLLEQGSVEVKGRLVSASNATLYAVVTHGSTTAACVYKPVAGERPLWDFPDRTLARREVAAYRVSVAGGFDVVPPTVLRDGPFGLGSLQLWVEPETAPGADEPADDADDEGDDARDDGAGDHSRHERRAGSAGREAARRTGRPRTTLVTAAEGTAGLVDVVPEDDVPPGWLAVVGAYGVDGEPVCLVHADDERLATLATFDVLANNADRKAGHLLAAPGERVVGVDHGLTFHDEPKLRTVLWGFAGRPFAALDLQRVERLARWLETEADDVLSGLLSRREIAALQARTTRALRRPLMPGRSQHRPAIPWPPF